MIEPTKADIGRHVAYHPPGQDKVEQGEITSYNDHYVFVRFGLGSTSAACRREDLNWIYRGSWT